ncbi:hypothetical protein FHS83_000664 [Rhizomicrobium palustre]|uniref:AB hydrolase-1 domain-containing protein n=1 Tax=Rhizomicrobium palustre TaxID=189966 RepID=A0A846MVE8_9PROT|nr:alpha/beta fold hydrolase [Rhizomicrobium palustre]NIK87346.1 hypothetical protein [Rhizomicrobium palustre]
MKIAIALTMLLSLSGAASAAEQEVSLGPLKGTLETPEHLKDGPAVLIIAGSGPTDRDGNSSIGGVTPATYKLLAQGLAAEGIPSLRYDKRGIGASKAALTREEDLRFSNYVDDAAGFAELLRSQPHVTCVVLFGHSEGALIAALAAAKTKVCGVISVAGAGFPADEIMLKQFAGMGLPAAALEQAKGYFATLKKGEMIGDVPHGWAAIFRPSIQPYMASWISVDPAQALGAVKAPVLILQGRNDIQVPVENVERLAQGAPKAKLVLLDGTNHVLKSAPAERAANVATYADPALPLAPGVVQNVVDFVKGLK